MSKFVSRSKVQAIPRIHVVGLPRSGTTSFARSLAGRMDLPYIEEPIFIWSNRFKTSIGDRLSVLDVQGIRKDISHLSKMFPMGYVEKTPHSIYLSDYFDEILEGTIVIILVRDLHEIVSSLNRKVFDNNDPNASAPLWFHNLSVRFQKMFTMIRLAGPVKTAFLLFHAVSWLKKNSILRMSNAELEKRMNNASRKLSSFANRSDLPTVVLTVDYRDYKNDNELTIENLVEDIRKLTLASHV